MDKKIAIVTDSNSGIRQCDVEGSDVYVVPMPFIIDGSEYLEDINLSQEEFYNKLAENADVSTSQPSTYDVEELWQKLLDKYESIIHIPMSSALSQSCQSAQALSKKYEGRVYVVDNQRISVTQKSSVYEAEAMVKQGKTALEIYKYLMSSAGDSSVYITVETLKYLKKGGRITPAAALFGSLMNIKPVLQIQGGKLDAYAKVLTDNAAKIKMFHALSEDLSGRFKHIVDAGEMGVSVAHTQNEKMADELVELVKRNFPNVKFFYKDPLSLSVSCHIGPGAFAIGCAPCRYL